MAMPVHVNIEEIRKPARDAPLIADTITGHLEKRVMFRRAMKARCRTPCASSPRDQSRAPGG